MSQLDDTQAQALRLEIERFSVHVRSKALAKKLHEMYDGVPWDPSFERSAGALLLYASQQVSEEDLEAAARELLDNGIRY